MQENAEKFGKVGEGGVYLQLKSNIYKTWLKRKTNLKRTTAVKVLSEQEQPEPLVTV